MHFKLAICIFFKSQSAASEMHSEPCVLSGQADKQLFRAHILFRILMTRLNSPTDDIPHILCAWIVCIYVRAPTARPVVPV